MSADNGIYVLDLPNKLRTAKEYRVRHAMAIDNLDYNIVPKLGYNPEMVVEYFQNAEFFTDRTEAYKRAVAMHDQYDYTEYGIQTIRFEQTWDEIKQAASEYTSSN